MFDKNVSVRRFVIAGLLGIMFMVAVSSIGRVAYAEGGEQPLVLGNDGSTQSTTGDNTVVDDDNGEITLAPNSPIQDQSEWDDFFGEALASGDFNGDGKADLAVGVPHEDHQSPFDWGKGAVHVIYGANGGLTGTGNQLFKPGLNLPAMAGWWPALGYRLVTGDYDGDGYDDLAVSAPGCCSGISNDKKFNMGATIVLYGTPSGLSTIGLQFWTLESPGVPGKVSQLSSGEALDTFDGMIPRAAGDFNKDGYDDLAFGVSRMKVSSKDNAGAVIIIYGSDAGLHVKKARKAWMVTRNTAGILGIAAKDHAFGYAMEAGDFDGDGDDDLAVGAGDWLDTVPDGECKVSDGEKYLVRHVIEGSATGLNASGDHLVYAQAPVIGGSMCYRFAPGVVGDFNGDGRDDFVSLRNAQSALLFMGQAGGLGATFKQLDCDDKPRVFRCGYAGATGDVNNDGKDDLAIGFPGDSTNDPQRDTTTVLYAANMNQMDIWSQASPGILGTKTVLGDYFGAAVAFGDFNGDGYDDLAIGAPLDSEPITAPPLSGAVNVIYGSPFGLNANGDQLWTQDS